MSKVENKQYLRQFEVIRNYFDKKELKWKDAHIFTTDSFKEAVKIASDSIVSSINGEFIQLVVYEADGETLVCRFFEIDIMNLYKLRRYLI